MIVVKPVTISDSIMTSSIAEPDLTQGEVEFIPNRYTKLDILSEPAFSVSSGGGKLFVRAELEALTDKDTFMTHKYNPTTGFQSGYTFNPNTYNNEFSCVVGGRVDKVAFIHQLKVAVGGFSVDDIVVVRVPPIGYPEDGWQYSITANNPDLFNSISGAIYVGTDMYIIGQSGDYDSGYAVLKIDDAKVGTVTEFFTGGPSITITGVEYFNSMFNVFGYDSGSLVQLKMGDGIYLPPTVDERFSVQYSTASDYAGIALIDGDPYTLIKSTNEIVKLDQDPLSVTYGYNEGDEVIVSSSHGKYTATSLTTQSPLIGVDAIPPTWVKTGASNKYAAFDEKVTTKSVSQLTQEIEISPNVAIGGIAGLNIFGATLINVTMTDPVEGEVYNRDVELADNSNIIDWFNYLWEPVDSKSLFVLLDLPPFASATTKITFTGASEISVGALIIGPKITIGQTDYDGTTIQELDFSTWDEDDFGNIEITKRPGAKLVTYGVKFNESQLNYVGKQLDSLRGTSAIYVASDGDEFDYTLVYGIKRESEIDVQPVWCSVPITVRGLT